MPAKLAYQGKLIAKGPWGTCHEVASQHSEGYEKTYDYSDFMNEQFWKPVADSKRKIRELKAQIKEEEKIMREHYVAITSFFAEVESDIE